MPPILTGPELCAVLRINRMTVTQWRYAGMPYIHIANRHYRYDYDEVLAWLRQRQKDWEEHRKRTRWGVP